MWKTPPNSRLLVVDKWIRALVVLTLLSMLETARCIRELSRQDSLAARWQYRTCSGPCRWQHKSRKGTHVNKRPRPRRPLTLNASPVVWRGREDCWLLGARARGFGVWLAGAVHVKVHQLVVVGSYFEKNEAVKGEHWAALVVDLLDACCGAANVVDVDK